MAVMAIMIYEYSILRTMVWYITEVYDRLQEGRRALLDTRRFA